MSERFALAPMSPGLYWLTVGLFALPLGLTLLAAQSGALMPWLAAGVVGGLYLSVWLFLRPSRFEISGSALDLVFPLRRISQPLFDVEGAELLTAAEFRARYGWALRFGAGGLWGGFGLLMTRGGTLRFYISRLDGLVLVRCRSARPLLITPADPERFVHALRERL